MPVAISQGECVFTSAFGKYATTHCEIATSLRSSQ